MKTLIAVISLGLLVSACAGGTGGVPAAEIASMSDSEIRVVYFDSVSGMGDATQMAKAHCDPLGAEPVASADATDSMAAVDRTVVTFKCK
jgi:uncharacterized protein involved in high-affinity Fe2+ transport